MRQYLPDKGWCCNSGTAADGSPPIPDTAKREQDNKQNKTAMRFFLLNAPASAWKQQQQQWQQQLDIIE